MASNGFGYRLPMISYCVAALCLAPQIVSKPTIEPAPVLLPGTHSLFHQLCEQVEKRLEKGDFVGAKAMAGLLPSKRVTFDWDDSAIPPPQRLLVRTVRSKLISDLGKKVVDFSFAPLKGSRLKFSFVEKLPQAEGSPLPAGAVHFTSVSARDQQLEVVIAVKRGDTLEQASNEDIANEILNGFVSYLGVAQSPIPGRASFRTEQVTFRLNNIGPEDMAIMNYNQRIVAILKDAVVKRRRMAPGSAKFKASEEAIGVGQATQGTTMKFTFQVTNLGNSPLMVAARADCGCVTVEPRHTIDPGASHLVRGVVDTTNVFGILNQRILIATNDPDQPQLSIPISFTVVPNYRVLMPSGSTAYAQNGKATQEIFLTLNEGFKLNPVKAQVTGIAGSYTVEPWTGELPDPELGEGPKRRSGYKFIVETEGTIPPGRHSTTLTIRTDHAVFRTIYAPFSIQTGIVAFPDSIYLGEIPRAPRTVGALLVRPGRPYNVLSATSTTKGIKVAFSKLRTEGEYRISVQIDGSQPRGDLNSMINVKTDDPDQPVISIPLNAILK